MSLRILIVSPVFWPEAFRVNDLAERLVEEGHRVEVLAGHPNYPEGRYFNGYSLRGPWTEDWCGVRILRFPQVPRGRGQAWRLALQYLSFMVLGSMRILSRGRWDWDRVFVFQTTPVTAALPAILAARLARARSVIWVQDLWPDSLDAVGIRLPSPAMGVLRRLSSWIYRRFDVVLGQSGGFLHRLEAMGVDPGRLSCVPQWADEISGEPRDKVPPAWGPGFTLLFAGNLGRAQGLECVLESAELTRHVQGLQWVLMGDGVLKKWLEGEIARRDLEGRVILTGRRPAEEMSSHYDRADVLLVSLRRDGALSCTIPGKLQACLAAGKPILASLDGEAAEVVRSAGAGRVVPAEDPARLAEGALALMNATPQVRGQMGTQGRAFYLEHFSQEACLDRILKALGSTESQSIPAR